MNQEMCCTNPEVCWIAWVIIIALAVLFIAMAIMSNILRDRIDNTGEFMANIARDERYRNLTQKQIAKLCAPFSLSRTQLGAWTVIIGSSYIYMIFCCDADFSLEKSATALALLGISVGTAGLATVIDKSQGDNPHIEMSHRNTVSKGFFIDIMSDEGGVSIHRFQNVVWTVIAIAIYLHKLSCDTSQLPELDGTLLTATGISSAAYLGLKMNENKATPPPPPPAPAQVPPAAGPPAH